MDSAQANGFVPPELKLSSGFEWDQTYDELLEQIAVTNIVDADWSILRDMIKYKVSENIGDYLRLGPPWPLQPAEAYNARDAANSVLDSFTGPPFTVQRLSELALRPREHYTSLPKYLRALNRVLSVSSERSAFNEDDTTEPFASTSAITLDTVAATGSGSIVQSPMIATRRPPAGTNATGSPKSSPSVVPLLSPIPWLQHREDDSDNASVTSMDLNGTVQPSVTGSNDVSPTRTRFSTAPVINDMTIDRAEPQRTTETHTPTGGLVDEVDPGSGGAEVVEPVELTSASMQGERVSSPGAEATSLRERFVRASSPKTEMPLDPEATDQTGQS
ncbi:protein phosphatase 4, regulatory subunit 2 [Microbotryomycetes sp. JL221]|nr:protein phosphatase 4, regulatory subunit 2 [Microbotryomycetes sp. JL221]